MGRGQGQISVILGEGVAAEVLDIAHWVGALTRDAEVKPLQLQDLF